VTEALVAGLLAGYGIAVPVGAIAPLLVSLTAHTSLRVGAAGALGVATADGVYATAAVLGGTVLAGLIAPVAVPMRWLAAAVLVVVGGRIAYGAWRQHRNGDTRGTASAGPAAPTGTGLTTPVRAYLGLLGLTLLNPATVIYFAALVVGREAAGGDAGGAGADAVFVVAAFAASASWQLLIAGGGSLLARVLTGPRGRLVTAAVSGLTIAVLAVALLPR
jgi:arginine exporter protein ArgO